MPRPRRDLRFGFCYHITTRCNNRRFNLSRQACRDVLLYAIRRAKDKYGLKLYGLCIMSNHVHYLLQPDRPEDLPRIMHSINWYTAMSFNRMLKRTGHFWEQRYYSHGFPTSDRKQALNILRYIHANPKAAGMSSGYSYRYSNYGTYERLTDDGITEWHPAFLRLGESLDECARRYRQFCRQYQPTRKPGGRRSDWGRQRLPELPKGKKGKLRGAGPLLPFGGDFRCQVSEGPRMPEAVAEVAKSFVRANRAGWVESGWG